MYLYIANCQIYAQPFVSVILWNCSRVSICVRCQYFNTRVNSGEPIERAITGGTHVVHTDAPAQPMSS